MNITFLIGNGFDLGVGVRSKFSDYFPIYCEEAKGKGILHRGLADKIEKDIEHWSYFERQLGIYTGEFWEDRTDVFWRQFEDFELGFIRYLKQEEATLSFDKKDEIAKQMRKGLLNFYSRENLRPGSSDKIRGIFSPRYREDHKYNFLSFNYTMILKDCLEAVPNGVLETRAGDARSLIGKVVYIHGTCDGYPIMGVNDASQIENPVWAKDERFLCRIVKSRSNERNRSNSDRDGAEIIKSSNIICVYGMSLGETDRNWWDRIINWLYADPTRQLVLFLRDRNYSTSSQIAFMDKEDEIVEKLSQFSTNESIAVEDLLPRIHIAVNKNIFQMNFLRDNDESEARVVAEQRDLATV